MIINNNLHGFDHDRVNKVLSGELTFLGTFTIGDEYTPSAWYTAWNPDRSKGHKDFVGLRPLKEGGFMIIGRDYDEFEEFLTVAALECNHCSEVIYSSYRHHLKECSCKQNFIDGGREYTRATVAGKLGALNLLTQVFTPYVK